MQDCDIIRDILDGQVNEFEKLVDKYRRSVISVVSKRVPVQDRESVAQEVFLKAYRGLKGFDLCKPFENWIVTIAVRTCCDYYRKEARKRDVDFSSTEEEHNLWLEKAGAADSIEEFESQVSRKETMEMLELVLKKLSSEDRALIELVYFDGWKLKDAAVVMGWKLSKAKVRAMRARNLMREIIGDFLY